MGTTLKRDELVANAQKVLHSASSMTELSKQTGINRQMLYEYRSGYRKLHTAHLETLLKFRV